VHGADLVVLATGIGRIIEIGERIAPHLKPGCVVTDVGSTKATIVARLEAVLPAGVSFVGGHPIAGSEKRGVAAAREDLFEGRACVLTPGARSAAAVERVAQLWTGVGAQVTTLSPEAHDGILARTSHLPHLAAAGLTASLADTDAAFAGTGFRDTTRVASGDVGIWCDIVMTNREAVLRALEAFGDRMASFRAAIASGDRERLAALLQAAKDRRDGICSDHSAAE
jgi:prephenate dehydrogenase